jgi:hypothetical protein
LASGLAREANARVARFAHDGLVVVHREFVGQASAIYVSRAGCTYLGQRPRKAPRPDMQRAHELAIARLAARLELSEGSGEMHVLTERECRRREAYALSDYRRVLFLVESPALARRLAILTRRISAELSFQPDAPQLVVMPHVELDEEQDAAVRAAITG